MIFLSAQTFLLSVTALAIFVAALAGWLAWKTPNHALPKCAPFVLSALCGAISILSFSYLNVPYLTAATAVESGNKASYVSVEDHLEKMDYERRAALDAMRTFASVLAHPGAEVNTLLPTAQADPRTTGEGPSMPLSKQLANYTGGFPSWWWPDSSWTVAGSLSAESRLPENYLSQIVQRGPTVAVVAVESLDQTVAWKIGFLALPISFAFLAFGCFVNAGRSVILGDGQVRSAVFETAEAPQMAGAPDGSAEVGLIGAPARQETTMSSSFTGLKGKAEAGNVSRAEIVLEELKRERTRALDADTLERAKAELDDPQAARDFLVSMGIYLPDGQIAPEYKS